MVVVGYPGYPPPGLDGVPPVWMVGVPGYPLTRTGWGTPPPIRQNSLVSTCYAAGGMPLAFRIISGGQLTCGLPSRRHSFICYMNFRISKECLTCISLIIEFGKTLC